jgi:hypothetical protein
MSQSLHGRHPRPLNLIRRRLAHLRRRAPIILPGQKVNRAFRAVDGRDAVAGVEAAEVEVEVAVKDAVGLAGVHVPDELFVDVGGFGALREWISLLDSCCEGRWRRVRE